jgi:hypothetical protein
MIFSEIFDLIEYIQSSCKVRCEFGDRDLGRDEYPFIKVLLIDEFEFFTSNKKNTMTDLPLTLKIITINGNEKEALEVLEKLGQKINQFNEYKGHKLIGSVIPDYVEENKTYEINVSYNLKLIIQDI